MSLDPMQAPEKLPQVDGPKSIGQLGNSHNSGRAGGRATASDPTKKKALYSKESSVCPSGEGLCTSLGSEHDT